MFSKFRARREPPPPQLPPEPEPATVPVQEPQPVRAFAPMVLERFDSLDAFRLGYETHAEEYAARQRILAAYESLAADPGIEFHCDVHGGLVSFRAESDAHIDWREGMPCSECRLNARMRFCLALMQQFAPSEDAPRVYLTEQTSFGYVAARRLWPGAVGSEYVPDDERREMLGVYLRDIAGDESLAVRHEDATALTLPDAAFDLLGSFDVLEHIPDYRAALREFARVLAPGGTMVLTAPFAAARQDTLVRARFAADSTVEHLETPEYHGDPVSVDGVLCFYHFGWSLLDDLREAGFVDAWVVRHWSPARGYLDDCGTFVARR